MAKEGGGRMTKGAGKRRAKDKARGRAKGPGGIAAAGPPAGAASAASRLAAPAGSQAGAGAPADAPASASRPAPAAGSPSGAACEPASRRPAGAPADGRTRKIAFFSYGNYDVAFKYFAEHVLDGEFIRGPEHTRRTRELGERYSPDTVCAPFKHILGASIEALEAGADTLVQFTGFCRLYFYGELQEQILRDLGYEFEMLNFASPPKNNGIEYSKLVMRFNPNLTVPRGAKELLTVIHIVEFLDEVEAYYYQNLGFEDEPGSFKRAFEDFKTAMRLVESDAEAKRVYQAAMERMRALPTHKPAEPLRVGVVGEYFTAVDAPSNLGLQEKLAKMGVEVHRWLGIMNFNVRFNEENARAGISDYVRYNMGPTSTATVKAALDYLGQGFDGLVHAKSFGCTPEIDVMPVLQRIGADRKAPILFLSYDSQTSDTGLDTRLEAFYDMIALKKARLTCKKPTWE